jgi:hypothetical protein
MSEVVDVLAYIQEKGLAPTSASRDEVAVPCFFHGEDPGTKRGRLYINVSNDPATSGLYFCHVCGCKGNIITLMRHFGDEPPKDDKDDDNHWIRQQILRDAAEYYHACLRPEDIRWLKEERGLTAETIKKHEIGYADGTLYRHLRDKGHPLKEMVATGLVALSKDSPTQDGDTLILDGGASRPYDFLRDCITIPYHVAGNCVQIRGKKIGGKYLTPPRQDARLYNTDAVWNSDTIVITEGELDALVVEQMGYAAVGSPGAKTWQPSWDGYFDGMRRIYIVFDNDAPGQLGADAIKERLGRKARSVMMPDGGLPPGDNDISEHFGKQRNDPDEFSQMLRRADRAGTLLVTPQEAFEEWASMQGLQGLQYGFEEFDAYMKPGHHPGAVWVVLAKTNVGKTLFLLNVFQRLSMHPDQQDKKILFCSLEQTRGDWFERARRIWNFWNLDCPPQEVNSETLKYWENRISLTDVNRMGVAELVAAIDDFADEHGQLPDLVAIDYLGYWARSFKGLSKYEQVTEAIMSLKEVGKERKVPILAPHQVSRSQEFGKEIEVDSGRDSGAIEETADGIFTLWNPDNATGKEVTDRTGRMRLKIGKTRAGSKGRVADFQFGYLSLAIASLSETDRIRMLVNEIDYDNRDDMAHLEGIDKWQAAIFRHLSGIKNGDIEHELRAAGFIKS